MDQPDQGGGEGQLGKVEFLKARASAEYPLLIPYHAFIIFMRYCPGNIWFLNEDGERCLWRPGGGDYHHYKNYRGSGWIQAYGIGNRLFYLRKYKIPMSYINRPKKKSVSLLVAHPSEKRWNLPKAHRRHFMKFPKETRDLILEWALVPGSDAVQPMMVTSNWKTRWNAQSLVIESVDAEGRVSGGWDHVMPMIVTTKHHDKHGEYVEYRDVNRAVIDATCLRACTSFYDDGMKMLYSKNTFAFNMCNEYIHRSPPTLLQNGEMLRPDPAKPSPLSSPFVLQLVQVGISEIKDQNALTSLSGWVYYDPFLRFLHTIGPQKFPLIKNLQFSGYVKLHSCGWENCKTECDDDLVISLQLYIPIIDRLLPNLEKLIIYAAEDDYLRVSDWPGHPDVGAQADGEEDSDEEDKEEIPTYESRLIALLENEIRSLSTIRSLEVFDGARKTLLLARSTMQWFKERSARIAHKKLVADLADHQAGFIRQSNVTCGFCGEGHIWAECYNLCRFCGDYGHFSKTCSARRS